MRPDNDVHVIESNGVSEQRKTSKPPLFTGTEAPKNSEPNKLGHVGE